MKRYLIIGVVLAMLVVACGGDTETTTTVRSTETTAGATDTTEGDRHNGGQHRYHGGRSGRHGGAHRRCPGGGLADRSPCPTTGVATGR